MVSVGDISSSAANDLFNNDLIAKMIAARMPAGLAQPADRAHFVDYVKQHRKRYGEQRCMRRPRSPTTLDLSTQGWPQG
jgi:hypothetical protein